MYFTFEEGKVIYTSPTGFTNSSSLAFPFRKFVPTQKKAVLIVIGKCWRNSNKWNKASTKRNPLFGRD